MTTREKFVAAFGEEQASLFEVAAKGHKNGVHDRPGSDPFRWVLCICIGYQCFEDERWRQFHKITAPADALKNWIKAEANLEEHDGDVDYLSLFCGVYNEYIKEPEANAQTN